MTDNFNGRIFFDNYPDEGIKLDKFVWYGMVSGNKIHFFLSVSSEENTDLEFYDDDHEYCWTAWGFELSNDGVSFPVSENATCLGLSEKQSYSFVIDSLENKHFYEWDEMVFGIYCFSGHNSTAGHNIEFTKTGKMSYRVLWTGKIAFTYLGENEYSVNFRIIANNVAFRGIYLTQDMSADDVYALARNYIRDIDSYKIIELPQSEYNLNKINRVLTFT